MVKGNVNHRIKEVTAADATQTWREKKGRVRKREIKNPPIHLLIPHQGRGGSWELSLVLDAFADVGPRNLGGNKCVQGRLAREGSRFHRSSTQSNGTGTGI